MASVAERSTTRVPAFITPRPKPQTVVRKVELKSPSAMHSGNGRGRRTQIHPHQAAATTNLPAQHRQRSAFDGPSRRPLRAWHGHGWTWVTCRAADRAAFPADVPRLAGLGAVRAPTVPEGERRKPRRRSGRPRWRRVPLPQIPAVRTAFRGEALSRRDVPDEVLTRIDDARALGAYLPAASFSRQAPWHWPAACHDWPSSVCSWVFDTESLAFWIAWR